ncbi:exopolysaccharide biosynthesis protein [Salinimonas lutimaris]|uniref:exopolysaccharide biosynthesis protein n=1 Tax=Salinimonas lutimaris TaxID=914153 RepID=UPI0010C0EE2D|nr:exopolysaccharide biosynthesis protein [Salinimonas lutimaris]
MTDQTLTGMLDVLTDDNSAQDVSLGDVVASFEDRGFGPLLLIPALLALLPTGAIPGVPSLCGVTLFLICSQLVAGRDSPWLPAWLKNRAVSQHKLNRAVKKARPWCERLEKFFCHRLDAVTGPVSRRFLALFSGLMALAMIPLELMPFAAAMPALAITVTALGLTYKDGAAVIVGVLLQAGTGVLLYYAMQMMG